MDSFNPEELCIHVIAHARKLYETNRYPSNYEGQSFASAREDALTFFHSEQFDRLCALLNLSAWQVRELADVPQPRASCRCESCRIDYQEEARLVQHLPRQNRFRFAAGHKHCVRYCWKGLRRDIVEIWPQSGRPHEWISAGEYLAHIQAKL